MAKYKVGDILRCIPGFKPESSSSGGAGYKEGLIFSVKRITNNSSEGNTIYWSKEGSGLGVYERAVVLADYVNNDYQIY